MNQEEMKIQYRDLDLEDMEAPFFLTGIMNSFMNRFQTVGDGFFEEISWKQCFVIICIRLFKQPPTLRELSEVMGSSHQNIKQMLLKLERAGFVELVSDASDRRKQRIAVTEKAERFSERYTDASQVFMKQLFQDVSAEELRITIQTIMEMDERLQRIAEQVKRNGADGFL